MRKSKMKLDLPKVTLIEKGQRKAFASYWFNRVFIDDWLMKVVALVITLTLWLGVTGLQKPITRRISDVSLNTLVSKGIEITNSLQPEVDIEITGDKRKVDKINSRDLVVTIDLTDVQEGDRTIQLTPQGVLVELPNGVTITKILPEKIAIKLEKIEEATVPVRIETTDSPANGFEVYSETASPVTVKIRGPKSFVESLSFVSTEKISLKGKNAGFVVQQVPLNISDPKISLVNSVTATVSIQIGRKRIERLLVVPYETETRKGRVVVTLYGPDTLLRDLLPGALKVIETRTPDGPSKLVLVLPDNLKGKVTVRDENYKE